MTPPIRAWLVGSVLAGLTATAYLLLKPPADIAWDQAYRYLGLWATMSTLAAAMVALPLVIIHRTNAPRGPAYAATWSLTGLSAALLLADSSALIALVVFALPGALIGLVASRIAGHSPR